MLLSSLKYFEMKLNNQKPNKDRLYIIWDLQKALACCKAKIIGRRSPGSHQRETAVVLL